ncbi:hypothetical protein RFN57_15075 [Streptomyces violaceochromogenes]|uniref:Uncharacterized protein n=1 Tax=Streptomyces violaceochromogenes TaxID=67377 RepID=A0ABU6LY98_9ACTN|nr:hypothetical protein [Streptomyces violaceochromogenes]MEC7053602.1 hypothetical protein [Streptomyces violaceochromogenes]
MTAETLYRELNQIRREMTEGRDVDDAFPDDDPGAMVDRVRALAEGNEYPSGRPVGRAGQAFAWDQFDAQLLPRLIGKVEGTLAGTVNTAGIRATFIGAKGDLAERTRMFSDQLLAKRPCVSISITGNPRRLFVYGHSMAASLSVLVHLPGSPLHAATVTQRTALMSSCSDAHRLARSGDWVHMAGAPLVPDADPGCVLLPNSLRHLEEPLRRAGYTEVEFVPVEQITPAVIEAVLEHAVPAAIHCSGHVLNSAIALVASRHGMTVRLYGANGKALEPWAASQMICEAATSGHPYLQGLIIARYATAALQIGRILDEDRAGETLNDRE